MPKTKKFIGIFICMGLAAIMTGAVIFFAHLYTSNQEKRVEAKSTLKLSTVTSIDDKKSITLCAHRGLSAIAPENTLAAFRAAGEAGYTRIEFDIRETKDGGLMILHDSTVNRMTDGKGHFSDLTVKELLALSIDNGANCEKFEAQKIPSLDEALGTCTEYGMTPVIELKEISSGGIKKLYETLAIYDMCDRAIIISFEGDYLRSYRKLCPEGEIWLLSKEITSSSVKFCNDNKGCVLSFSANEKNNDSQTIADVLSAGVKMNCWTVDSDEVLKNMYALGIRDFTTNTILPMIGR